ncbi:MAG: aminomethyl-transferring glycine dehydrogenase [Rhodospirillales bacterium]|jgi:glycine dehydrogenase|nr:aminomethyl-transferring glycine dehydrogenase [Rhodospirillales bacterium]MBT5521035.1 aminomethyl-transferring glycine dehydrogenase [Rhodospirillales bacterium]MBT6111625.1 aminomethyl-transferring glycine dehydrogenase [Rhodospirillales bacterium]MBT7147313.1 aminomethyl-transferring glycine dehydrogenase [Rhodospirillales bacterium]
MPHIPLIELENKDDFIRRHIGPGDEQVAEMLDVIGMSSVDELIDKTVPSTIRSSEPLQVPESISERYTLSVLRRMSDRNQVFISMIGMGYYGTVIPNVILRNVLENPGWYTAYSPYQAEVSQGRLEAVLNFQQMVMDMTGMDLANASLLDEATAAAEAMSMAHRVSKKKGCDKFFVDANCHPQTIAVVQTRAGLADLEIIVGDPWTDMDADDVFGVLLQYPGSDGNVRDPEPVIKAAHDSKALACVATDLLSLALLKPPGEMDADIVIGSSQRFGVPMGYGGPHAAFFATKDTHKRQTPGRIIGVSTDSHGKMALRMALQTREQHIRREKATSNICTAQVLLAVLAGFYAVYHGPDGIKRIASKVHRMTRILADGLKVLGVEVVNDAYFDTLTIRVRGQAGRIAAKARESRINLRVIDADHLGISLDETTRRRNLMALWQIFDSKAAGKLDINELDDTVDKIIPKSLARTSNYLEHPVFSLYHAETEMLRYLRWLQARDIALDRAMIPLGSCTMKLNATTEMIPVTWRNFSALHPFAPLDQTQGYQQLFEELEEHLCEITGFDAMSLQPNAGSQGEFSGLAVIRRYHESRGDNTRNICLIPASSHGTNPASAHMAGMKVVVVATDDGGNVDVADLKAKAAEHSDNLAALMITYPSTHGVFEEAIVDICATIHDNGGQVYLDGANMNALVGLAQPGKFGADVMHLNLHKTFAIPHGGGGPGVGPIGCGSHLAPFLPDHPVVEGVNPAEGDDGTVGTVAAAPWGSANILPISWAYIAMLGPEGLRQSSKIAILSANYIAKRLNPHFPVLYTGKNGTVAHECIVDLRPIKESCGITNEDVAKRLVDYGFHAPTMSFPVVDTLMIEPTESEAKRELDRFCDAMIQIRAEIADIESGKSDPENNLLHNAPHTHELLMQSPWSMPYSKEEAYFPIPSTRDDKYWPPVGRVDNVLGDRVLICSCPPMEAYEEAAE